MKMTRVVAVAAALMLPLAACGGSSDDAGSDSDSGAWSYTDDLGTKISLDSMPDRIVAQTSVAAALTDLGLGDKIVGTFGPRQGAEAEGLETDGVTDVTGGGEFGNVDEEKVASLRPDLIVTSSYIEPDLWYVNDATKKKLEQGYKIAAISFDKKSLSQIFDGTERLATALGAEKSDFSEGRADFEEAGKELQAAYKKAGDRSLLAVSYSKDLFYVSNPERSPDLKYYKDDLGLDVIQPDNVDPQGYFESLSWEKSDKYDADVAFWDARIMTAGLDALKKEKVWGTTKAARDDAYIAWNSVVLPPAPAAYADAFDDFADDLEKVSSK